MMMGVVGGPDLLRASFLPHGGAPDIANGTSVTATTVVAFAQGGFPPYTIGWSDDDANVFCSNPTEESCPIRSTGTDTENDAIVTLTVTDSAGRLAFDSAVFIITHGTPP